MNIQEKVIRDTTYRVRPLGGKASQAVQFRIARVLAAAVSTGKGFDLGRLWEAAKGLGLFADPGAAMRSLDESDFNLIVTTFAASTTVLPPNKTTLADGTTIDHEPKPRRLADVFDEHLAGPRQLDLWPWLSFCFEVNFGDGFFSEGQGAAGPEKGASPSSSHEGSTGFSGGSTSRTG